jgi:hypothetical protein
MTWNETLHPRVPAGKSAGGEFTVTSRVERTREQTDTEEFKDKFSGSQVVDKDGKPLLVFHGSEKPIDRFDPYKTQDGNLWFSSDRSSIERGESGAASSKVITPVYLVAKKLAGWKQYESMMIDQIIQAGYDGIKLDNDYIVFRQDQVIHAKVRAGSMSIKPKAAR